MKIPFNKPYLTGDEVKNILDAVNSGHISGNGNFTRKCQTFFETKYRFTKTLLTSSCTDALEMCALLLNIKPGDEVIVPSFTFVSTALAFVRQGANIVFADSRRDHPNIDEHKIESLITQRTKAIVVVHYAGMACNMDLIMDIANRYNLYVVEDAAQAIDSYFKGIPLGSIGHLGTFSFHETKNIQCGEGGLLIINNEQFIKRAEIIWEKGTNRAEFFRGEVNKYGWVDIGSSFLPADLIAAFLYAQLKQLNKIQNRRLIIWNKYYDGLKSLADQDYFRLPITPDYSTNNAHMFYLVMNRKKDQENLIAYLKSEEIHAVFHYLALHKSPFYKNKYKGFELPNSDIYTQCLVRLPLYYELGNEDQIIIINKINSFFDGITHM